MTAAARNAYKGEASLSDEARLARSFAKMEAAVEEAVSAADAPWVRAKRLGVELSKVLAEIGGNDFAYIQPSGIPLAVFFGSLSANESDLADLELVIEAHRNALQAWKDTSRNGDLEADGPAYDAFCEAEMAFVAYKCMSNVEAQRKIFYATECREVTEALKNDYDSDGRSFLSIFLESVRQEQNTGDEFGRDAAEYDPVESSRVNPRPIAALYAEWERQLATATTDRSVEQAFQLKKLIMPKPATTLQEFAMKVLVDTGYGEHILDDTMIQEARELVASTPSAVAEAKTKPIPTDKRIISALCDLEHEICSLRSMVNILGDLLDDNLVDVETGSQSNQGLFKIWLTGGTMNMLSFSWNDVIGRANRLERSFYAAIDGEGGQ